MGESGYFGLLTDRYVEVSHPAVRQYKEYDDEGPVLEGSQSTQDLGPGRLSLSKRSEEFVRVDGNDTQGRFRLSSVGSGF